MNEILDLIKGIHPGLFLNRELTKRKIKKSRFALSIHEYPQTLVAITKGKRRINTALSIKLEKALGFDEGFFMTLQVFYDLENMKKKMEHSTPDLNNIRSILFWDTSLKTINWQKQKSAVLQRVFERGNEREKKEIEKFYTIKN